MFFRYDIMLDTVIQNYLHIETTTPTTMWKRSEVYSFDTDVMITHRSIVSSHFRFPTIRFLKWFTFKKTKIQVWNLKELLIIVLKLGMLWWQFKKCHRRRPKNYKFSSKIWYYLWFLFEEGMEFFFKDFKPGISY